MSWSRPSVSGRALAHRGEAMEEIEPVEILLPRRWEILLQPGLSMLWTLNANGQKVFQFLPRYRLPTTICHLLTTFLFNSIPPSNG
jgi:hypothetical protein